MYVPPIQAIQANHYNIYYYKHREGKPQGNV